MNPPFSPVFVSKTAWLEETDHKFVSGCSDGRFFPARIEFYSVLEILRPDHIDLPGGVGIFSPTDPFSSEKLDKVKLLHDKHTIEHFFGFSHQGCGYYAELYKECSPEQIFSRQVKDLYLFRESMLKIQPKAKVDLFYERPQNGKIEYLHID